MSRTNVRLAADLSVTPEDVRDEASFASGMIVDRVNRAPSAPLAAHEFVHSSDEELRGGAPAMVTVRLRMQWSDDRIRTIPIVVIDLGDLTEEIRLNGYTVGFIGRAGRIFVARAGTRWDRAEECGQSLFWDKAATILIRQSGHLVERKERDSRLSALSGGPKC